MPAKTSTRERYTIRRQVFKLLGAGFDIYNHDGVSIGYCKQKAFKLREDIRICTNKSCTEELLLISARSIVDFGASYDVRLPTGETIGSFRRRGLKSMLRDSWGVFDPAGTEIARITEDSGALAVLRRLHEGLAAFIPQKHGLKLVSGEEIATYRTHFNLFVYRLGISVHDEHESLDDLMILAAGCLLAAIEGRQG